MDSDDRQKFKDGIEEMCGQLAIIDSAKEHMKDIVDTIKEYVDLKPADINKLARLRYKDNLKQARAEAEELFEVFEELFINNG